MKNRLWVCGCSFSSANGYYPDQSWSEILASKLNMEMRSLARDASSNGLIAEQVDWVINVEKPSLIVFNSTLNPRIEFKPRAAEEDYVPGDGPFQFFYYDDETLPGYYGKPVSYTQHRARFNKTKTRIVSEAVSHLNRLELMKRLKVIHRLLPRHIDLYLNNLYDNSWETKKQVLMFVGLLARLEKKNIPYLFTPSPEMQDYNKYWFEFNKNSILTGRDVNIYNFYNKDDDSADNFQHLHRNDHKVLADNIYKHILSKNILGSKKSI